MIWIVWVEGMGGDIGFLGMSAMGKKFWHRTGRSVPMTPLYPVCTKRFLFSTIFRKEKR